MHSNPIMTARRARAAIAAVLLVASVPLFAGEAAWRMPAGAERSAADLEAASWVRDYGSYVWIVGDDEALGTLSDSERIDSPYRIGLHGALFDPSERSPRSTPRSAAGDGLVLVQLRGPALPSDIEALRVAGLDPFQPLPGFAFLAWGNDSARNAAAAHDFVRHIGGLDPALKLQPSLKDRGAWIRNVNIHVYNDGEFNTAVAALQRAGVKILDAWPAQPDRRLYNIVAEIGADTLSAATALPRVVAISYLSPEPQLEDESGAQVLADNIDGSNAPFPGYPAWLGSVGLDGSGVTWATTDSGVWYGHGDYNSRIVGGINYAGCNQANPGDDPTTGGHGTHVTGIYAGDGAAGYTDGDGFLYGLGVAPAVSVFAQNPICTGGVQWPPAGGWQVLSRDALAGGAIGSNNSWTSGEGTQHGYQASERTYDLMVLDGNFDTPSELDPFMAVFSAGNSGQSGVTAPKEAKNVVVTGSTQTFRVSGNIDAVSGFSSRGPAVDGRILPTISAPGETVSSTRRPSAGSCATAIGGTDGQYAFCSGTSMAAPHASGALILLTQWWRQQFGVDPSPAMGKALLVNSAVPIGAPPPNNDSGWGRIDLSTIVDDGNVFEFWDQSELFTASGQSFERTVGVIDPSKPLKITLVWSDAPGAVGANPALVNDLDLRVVSGVQTYLGNNFSGGLSQPGGTPDRLNNIEQVTLANPGADATITIDAFTIAGSVLINQQPAPPSQHFALVCQNCLQDPDFTLAIDPFEITACVPDNRDVAVDVGSLLGFSDPVSLTVTGLPSGTSGSFSTNPVNPLPGSSTLSLTLGGGTAPGTTTAAVEATSSTGFKSLPLTLNTFNANPGAPALTAPADGAFNTPTTQVFSWSAATQGLDYRLEVATDAGFANVVHDISTRDTSVELSLNSSTIYYWRVTVENACGSEISAVFSFTTQPEPGDCPIGVTAAVVWSDDMESGANGWTLGAGSIQNTWQQSGANVHGGAFAWNAENLASISDQRLVSPAIALPGSAELPLTLRFWNQQELEDAAGACWDGAVLEISTDGGSTWTDLNGAAIINRAHDGPVNNFASGPNPLAGMQGWCGDPRAWEDYAVDLSAYTGQTVNLRFRVGTDGTVGGRDGWTIDDVRIESCPAILLEEIFIDGFEST